MCVGCCGQKPGTQGFMAYLPSLKLVLKLERRDLWPL